MADQAYIQLLIENDRIRTMSDEDQYAMKGMHYQAGIYAGKDWNEFSPHETTDEGIEMAAIIMAEYRKRMPGKEIFKVH